MVCVTMRADQGLWLDAVGSPDSILAGCTTRLGGVSVGEYAQFNLASHVGDAPLTVAANRQNVQVMLGATAIQWLDQVHSKQCIYADLDSARLVPTADAMWTDVPGLALGILTADCVPILVWSQSSPLVGAVHAGWRGLRDGVIDELVARMSTRGRELRAWIGPCIGVDHYEVGADVWREFSQSDMQVHAHDPAKRMLDLSAVATERLKSSGVTQVTQTNWCSYSDPRFYSYRQAQTNSVGSETGRMASVIMLSAQNARPD
jgi:YfiH family protein